MSLTFLNHKSWHVTTVKNQKRLWEAEEKERNRQKEVVRRAAILRKEKQLSDPALTSILRNGGVTGEARSVSFMYEPPPGYVPPEPTSETGAAEMAMIQARAAALASLEEEVEQSEEIKNQGPRKHQHPFPKELEAQMEEEKRKAAEKKAQNDQMPKNSNKPLGMILRDVKCLRCGQMGHKSGDRECPMYDANPNDITRRRREDPLTRIQASQGLDANSKLKLIYTEDPVVGGVPNQSELNTFITDPDLERQRKLQHREIIALGSSSESSDDSSSSSDSSVELTATENAFLESLTAEEMMILLKRYKREKRLATKQRWKEKMRELKLKRMVKIEGQERNEEQEKAEAEYKEERKKQRKKRKGKKRKKHSDSDGDSSTSSSSSDSSSSDTDSRHRRRKHKHRKSDHTTVPTSAPTLSSSSTHPTTSSTSHPATSTSTSTSTSSTISSSAIPRRRPRPVPVKSETIDLTDDIDDVHIIGFMPLAL